MTCNSSNSGKQIQCLTMIISCLHAPFAAYDLNVPFAIRDSKQIAMMGSSVVTIGIDCIFSVTCFPGRINRSLRYIKTLSDMS
ncbi:hypothetical protein HOY82DRAFT_551120 [Tuber indicum]|nr:hypothetical protein HOY82DRAFT_551120 [Tuber indicum]